MITWGRGIPFFLNINPSPSKLENQLMKVIKLLKNLLHYKLEDTLIIHLSIPKKFTNKRYCLETKNCNAKLAPRKLIHLQQEMKIQKQNINFH
jgi:hypothetical protein